ncbi:MAG: hypothetical protein D3921_08460 [Candidatus Electrothrix sp. AW1]|nr:hypothetical protein [Candidatus Electrothrix gigas]
MAGEEQQKEEDEGMAAITKIWGALVLYGAFTVALLLTQLAQAAPEPVQTELGAIIQGRLEEGDSRLSAGQYADAYTFAGTAGEEVLLNLASSDFDGFLSLLNSEGDLIAIDDDTGDGTGALISKFSLPETDIYTVQVSSYHADETGEYTLSLHDTPVVYSAEELALGERITGELTADDEQFDSGQHFDAYTFAAQAGQAVALTVRSKAFDSYLWLLNEDERIITVNDDAESTAVPGKGFYVMPGRDGHPGPVLFLGRESGPTSQIVFFPPVTGTYTVLAGSRDAGAEGKYSLDIATVAVPGNVSSGGNLADGASGELGSSDYQLSTGQYVDVYTFSGEQGQSISILLNSSSFSGLLRIFDSQGNLVREATSIENFILPAAGTYYLWVSSIFNGSTGEYSLSFSDGGDGSTQELSLSSEAGNNAEEGVQLFLQETRDGRAVQGDAAFSEMAATSDPRKGATFSNPYRAQGDTTHYSASVKVTVSKSRVPLEVTVTLTEGTGNIVPGGSPKTDTITSANCSGDYCTKIFTPFNLEPSANAPAAKYTINASASGVGSDLDYLYIVDVEIEQACMYASFSGFSEYSSGFNEEFSCTINDLPEYWPAGKAISIHANGKPQNIDGFIYTWTATPTNAGAFSAAPDHGGNGTATASTIVFTPSASYTGDVTIKVKYAPAGKDVAEITGLMKIFNVELKSIEFTSDHEDSSGNNILKDNNSDWKDTGTSYSEPEWVSGGSNNPISQTKNTKITVKVKVKVEPSGITFDLKGDGPNNYVDFNKADLTSTGADQEITLTADANLPNQVDILTKNINWKIKIETVEFNAGASENHKIYVTYGTPSGSVVTEKRLSWSCSVCDNKSDTDDIVLAAHAYINTNTPPKFDVRTSAWPSGTPPIWKILDSTHSGGSCIAHSNLLKYISNILGIPGGNLVNVYSSSDLNFNTQENLTINGRTCTVVVVVDRGSGAYEWNYFEGCLSINSKYYPGAFGTASFTSKKNVHSAYAAWPNRLLYVTIDSGARKFMDKDYTEYTNPLSVPQSKLIPLP